MLLPSPGRETLVLLMLVHFFAKVAWIKSDSKAILAIHDHVISNTHKISVTHNDKDTWTLTIKEVKRSDAGIYMCQVNSEPMVFKVRTSSAFLNSNCSRFMLYVHVFF